MSDDLGNWEAHLVAAGSVSQLLMDTATSLLFMIVNRLIGAVFFFLASKLRSD